MYGSEKWIIDFNEEWHIGGHKGWLAPLKRALQGDLGIFLYDGQWTSCLFKSRLSPKFRFPRALGGVGIWRSRRGQISENTPPKT